jgi:hypothetical protein
VKQGIGCPESIKFKTKIVIERIVINSPISSLSLTLAVTCYPFILSICLSDAMKIRLSKSNLDQLWNWQAFEHIPIALITQSLLGAPQRNGRAFKTHTCYLTRQVATTTPWEGLWIPTQRNLGYPRDTGTGRWTVKIITDFTMGFPRESPLEHVTLSIDRPWR